MKLEDIVCHKCGQNAMEAGKRGAYLGRIKIKGKKLDECVPSCEHLHGNQNDALLGAITDNNIYK